MGEKVQQLQLLQHNMQNLLQQKQQAEAQETELDTALQEVSHAEKAYKLVGKIMVLSPQEQLVGELKAKKEVVAMRMKNILRQEEQVKKKIEEVQKETLKELQQEKR